MGVRVTAFRCACLVSGDWCQPTQHPGKNRKPHIHERQLTYWRPDLVALLSLDVALYYCVCDDAFDARVATGGSASRGGRGAGGCRGRVAVAASGPERPARTPENRRYENPMIYLRVSYFLLARCCGGSQRDGCAAASSLLVAHAPRTQADHRTVSRPLPPRAHAPRG